jgi:hypothetical protein
MLALERLNPRARQGGFHARFMRGLCAVDRISMVENWRKTAIIIAKECEPHRASLSSHDSLKNGRFPRVLGMVAEEGLEPPTRGL